MAGMTSAGRDVWRGGMRRAAHLSYSHASAFVIASRAELAFPMYVQTAQSTYTSREYSSQATA
jgi:hypothetical protein